METEFLYFIFFIWRKMYFGLILFFPFFVFLMVMQ